MLGRAAEKYEPPAPKMPPGKQLFPTSSPATDGNIEDQFTKARKSSQTIGGFTGYKNTAAPLNSRSVNVRPRMPYKSTNTVSTAASTAISTAPSTAILSVFTRDDSFQEPVNTPSTPIDLTQEDPNPTVQSSHPAVDFNEDDFDNDSDLDLDMEYEVPTALPMAAPPRPQKTTAPSQSPNTLPQASRQLQRQNSFNHPSSGAVSWETSPPSHRATPPGSKRRFEESGTQNPVPSSVDEDPIRPAKRRTLPWLQQKAEEDDIAAKIEEEAEEEAAAAVGSSPPLRICAHCKKAGHASSQCPKSGKWDFKPKEKGTPKDKRMPWNNTGSALRDDKKKHKDKQKVSRKIDSAQTEAAARHAKTLVMAPVTLSEEQQRVKKLVVQEGKSVFFTGSAGTGKSVLMRAIIAELRKKFVKESDRVAVTASTGLAACNVGGVTLHSFGGIGLGKEDVPTLVKKIKRNAKAKNRWIRTKILIIDEISMVDGDLFDKLEGIARAMRNNGRPFGGIQLVITGDFFQLPPVPEYGAAKAVKFAFDAGTWPTTVHHTIGLTEVFRQKDPGMVIS